MKYVSLVLVLIFIVAVIGIFPKGENSYDYLRIHIRANSNISVDQDVKYQIKDKIVAFLTPFFNDVDSKTQAIEIVESKRNELQLLCDSALKLNGFSYTSNIKINNEYFPTRNYDNITLQSEILIVISL